MTRNIIPGFPFHKRICPEFVKELKIDGVKIDFVFGVFFEIQEKVFESPVANDGYVSPDWLLRADFADMWTNISQQAYFHYFHIRKSGPVRPVKQHKVFQWLSRVQG